MCFGNQLAPPWAAARVPVWGSEAGTLLQQVFQIRLFGALPHVWKKVASSIEVRRLAQELLDQRQNLRPGRGNNVIRRDIHRE